MPKQKKIPIEGLLDSYEAALIQTGYSITTKLLLVRRAELMIRRHLNVGLVYFDQAVINRYVSEVDNKYFKGNKKPDSIVAVDYMSMAAITAIIEQPDTSMPKGLRDKFFMMLLYDTGARIQEILDIRLCDLQLGRLPKVTLFGKGRKTRIIPLMERTVQHLKKYLLVFHAEATVDSPLFYSVTHGEKHPLTSRMAQYILRKYGEQAWDICQEVPKKSIRICFVIVGQCICIKREWT